MTPDTALRLSKAFGTTPAYWMNMQVNHDLVAVQATTENDIERTLKAIGAAQQAVSDTRCAASCAI